MHVDRSKVKERSRCSSARVTRIARSTDRYTAAAVTGSQRNRMNSHVYFAMLLQRDHFSAGNTKTAAEPPSTCGMHSCKFLSTFLSFVSVRLKKFVSFHFFLTMAGM